MGRIAVPLASPRSARSSIEGWSAIATWRPTLVQGHRDHEVLASHGIRDEIQCLLLRARLPEVGNIHPVELGASRNELVLIEDAHADQNVAEVGPRRGIRSQRLLDLRLGREVALQEHLLEPKA